MRRPIVLAGFFASALAAGGACNTPDARFRDAPIASIGGAGGVGTGGAGTGGAGAGTGGAGTAGAGTGGGGAAGHAPFPTPDWVHTFANEVAFDVAGVTVHPGGAATLVATTSGLVDLGAGFVEAKSSSSLVLAHLDASGTLGWSHVIGGPDDEPAPRAVAADGADVIVAGAYDGALAFPAHPLPPTSGHRNVFLARLGPDGAPLWTRGFPGADDQEALAVAVDSAHDLAFGGCFLATIDLGGGPITATGANYADGFVAKLAADGTYKWSRALSGDGEQVVTAVGTLGTDVILGGTSSGPMKGLGDPPFDADEQDSFLARLDGATGAPVWTVKISGPSYQEIRALAVSASGDIAVVGSFTAGIDLGAGIVHPNAADDVFAAVYDQHGALRWGKAFGDALYQDVTSVAFDAAGDVILTGELFGSIDLGGGPLTNPEPPESCKYCLDVFVARLDGATGAHRSSARYGAAGRDLGLGIVAAPGGFLLAGQQDNALDLGGGKATSAGGGFLARFTLTP